MKTCFLISVIWWRSTFRYILIKPIVRFILFLVCCSTFLGVQSCYSKNYLIVTKFLVFTKIIGFSPYLFGFHQKILVFTKFVWFSPNLFGFYQICWFSPNLLVFTKFVGFHQNFWFFTLAVWLFIFYRNSQIDH